MANRVEFVKDHSDKSQWHYISSKQNPADYASRGIDVCTGDKVKRWYLGPQFLWETEVTWNDSKIIPPVNEKDPELKKEFAVCHHSLQMFWQLWKIEYQTGPEWLGLLHW